MSKRKKNQVLTKNLFLQLKNFKVGFAEVEQIAAHMVEQQKEGKKERSEKYLFVKDIMKHKLNNVEICVKNSIKNLKESELNLSKVVRKNTIVREEFMDLVTKEVNKVSNLRT